MINRFFDILFSIFLLLVFIFPMIIISILILFSSGLPIIHYSKRYGINKKIFIMPKFRTFKKNSPDLPTHQLYKPDKYITKIGKYLRKYSLDELPQIYSVLKGDMSIVGPRPALHNQKDLIKLRDKYNINSLYPGITGYAQINGRDKNTIEEKVILEKFYYDNVSFKLNLKIIIKTAIFFLSSKDVKH